MQLILPFPTATRYLYYYPKGYWGKVENVLRVAIWSGATCIWQRHTGSGVALVWLLLLSERGSQPGKLETNPSGEGKFEKHNGAWIWPAEFSRVNDFPGHKFIRHSRTDAHCSSFLELTCTEKGRIAMQFSFERYALKSCVFLKNLRSMTIFCASDDPSYT